MQRPAANHPSPIASSRSSFSIRTLKPSRSSSADPRATSNHGGCQMDAIKTRDEIDVDRRRFFGTAAMAVVATQLGMIRPAAAQRVEAKMPAIKPGTNTSFGPLKQIDAGVLNIGYA